MIVNYILPSTCSISRPSRFNPFWEAAIYFKSLKKSDLSNIFFFLSLEQYDHIY